MQVSWSVRVIKSVKIRRKNPRVELRAIRVRGAPSVPRGVVTVKIPKDESSWGGRKNGRRKRPRASLSTTDTDGGDVSVKERQSNRAEVNVNTEEIRIRVRRSRDRDRPRRMCKTVTDQRQHTTPSRGNLVMRDAILAVALISRNPKTVGRAKLSFLDKNKVEVLLR